MMRILFVHQSYPAQFGQVAHHLSQATDWQCTFVSQSPPGMAEKVERIQYILQGGATEHTHFCSRTFENNVWHADAVYQALKGRGDISPDLIVGHSGFGSTLFLRELYPKAPVVNLFEYYYLPHQANGDTDFRTDLGWELDARTYQRSRCRNAMVMLDLHNCQAGYCPTQYQRSRFPAEYQPKLRTVFDGIDRRIFHGHRESLRPPLAERQSRTIAGVQVGAEQRVVTYVSRSLESMRGFDIFMKTAKLISQQLPDTVFFIIGNDGGAYGGDEQFLPAGQTFKDWVLEQDNYDLSNIHFVGWQTPPELAETLASTDLHIYLTVPFVLSWSMLNAMSCGATVLASDTAPVREVIQDGVNGLLADFFNPHDFAHKAVAALQDVAAARPLGRAAEATIAQRYSLEVTLPRLVKMYQDVASQGMETLATQDAKSLPEPDLTSAVVARATAMVSDGAVVSTMRSRDRSPFRG